MIRVPRPETKSAWLINAVTGKPTPHQYVATVEAVTLAKPGDEDELGAIEGGPAWHHLFECQITGVQRVWGTEDRAPSTFDVT